MKVALEAIFSKATTTVDGGWRISFDVSEAEAQHVAELSKLRNMNLFLCIMNNIDEKQNDASVQL